MQDEIDLIIERLKNGCTYHRFDEPGVVMEYVRILGKYSYRLMNKAVDIVLEEDSRNVPPISALVKAYKKIEEEDRSRNTCGIEVKNAEYCAVCDDKGFILMTKYIKNGDEELPYQYVLYCPFCAVGRSHAFDGSQCKEKIPYKVPPLTKYFDEEGIEALRDANIKRHKASENVVTRIDFGDLAIGRPMPNVPEAELRDDFEEVPF